MPAQEWELRVIISASWTTRPKNNARWIAADGDPETKRKAIEGGAERLLTKPIDFTLLEEIDARLERAS